MKRKINLFKIALAISAVILVAGLSFEVVSADEIPYGVMLGESEANNMTEAGLDSLREILGFNLLYTCSPDGDISLDRQWHFNSLGFDIIAYMTDPDDPDLNEAFLAYLNGHYIKTEAENTSDALRFLTRNGHIGQDPDWYVASKRDTSYYFLDDLWYRHEMKAFGPLTVFQPFLRIRLWREAGVQDADTVVTLILWKSDSQPWTGHDHRHNTVYKTYAITADSFPNSDPVTLNLVDFSENLGSFEGFVLTYQLNAVRIGSIASTCSLAVDWLMVYNPAGEQIMLGYYDSLFIAHVESNPPARYFQLRDDMHSDMMMPARHMEELIEAHSATTGMMKFYEGFIASPNDMLKIAGTKRFWIDRYPLYGGTKWDTCAPGGPLTYFTGYDHDPDTNLYGLQYRLDAEITSRVGTYKTACGDSVDLWYTPQAQSGQHGGCDCELYWNRPPTAAELSMQVWMALCYGVAGIQFWPYGYWPSGDRCYVGLVDQSGHPTPSWTCLEERVTPYLKAIDSVYLGLTWQRAYAYHQGTPSRLPPVDAFVDSIFAISNSPDSNPDLGWFHVGEFDDGEAYYAMIVNRACSRGPDDPTEAPSITATIRFNDANLSGGHHYYVIDLATGTDSSDWEGVPETTYTAVMADGYIPFTTTFRAGEGRLFKIVEAQEKILHGTLDTNLVYQGKIKISGDVTVPSGGTFKVKGPTSFNIGACDVMHSGKDTGAVEIICNGRLDFKGMETDSIFFSEFYDCGALLVTPTPGIWYGIRFEPGSSGSLDYCAILYAINGIEIDNNPPVTVNHSLIKSCEISGIDSYKGYLDVFNSRIDYNGIYGIYSYMSVDSICNSYLYENGDYGIYINYPISANAYSYIRFDTLDCPSGQPTQSGIMISNNDYVQIYKTKVRNHENSITCYNSNASIRNCYLSLNEVGVYSQQTASPTIRNCYFSSSTIGVKTASSAGANVGVGADSGNCAFLGYNHVPGRYYIYHPYSPLQLGPITVTAEYNWYDTTRPIEARFYAPRPNVIDWSPYLTGPPPSPRLDPGRDLPLAFSLGQNYPNPFNPQTTIRFTLDAASYTTVMIYNILGQQVNTLISEQIEPGEHTIIWNGRDSRGNPVSSGIYFYTIQAGEHFESKKMVMVR